MLCSHLLDTILRRSIVVGAILGIKLYNEYYIGSLYAPYILSTVASRRSGADEFPPASHDIRSVKHALINVQE